MIDRQEKLKYCVGCDSDFYNHEGHSTTGECWSLESAKLCKRFRIGWWTPMDRKENFVSVKVLACRTETGRFAYLEALPEHLRRRR